MTAKWKLLAVLVIGLLQPRFLQAQSDSLAFDQGRLRIWCETARFVYDDNEADSLLPSINCQSWEALKLSLRGTDAQLGVMRLMKQVDNPRIYTGYTDTEKKLEKLAEEITRRLKESPVRAQDPQRLEKVDILASQLQWLARKADPQNQTAGATAGGAAVVAPDLEEDEELMPPPGDPVPLEPKNAFPWNEALQWLVLLLLGGYLAWRLQNNESRYRRLKSEFRELEQQVNSFFISNTQPTPIPANRLSEQEVREVVKEELEQNKEVAKAATALAGPELPLPPPPPQKEAQTSAGRASSAAATAPAAAEVPSEGTGLYYDKMPFRGGFHQNEMSRERQRDSLYTIRVLANQPGEAEYWVSEDPDTQRYAMQNGLSFFEEGCDFTEVEENPARVVNEQKGRLRKEGAFWKILQKARVRFE